MTDAPETIWAGPSEDDKGVFWDVGHWDADYDAKCTEYTRTDISQTRVTELEAALKSLCNEVHSLEVFESDIRYGIGNTNFSCIQSALVNARKTLKAKP
jgi:hypothetical protein